jgi:hypothetical protein
VNQPEFILEPNALITGSEYFRTALEDKFDKVSSIDCDIPLENPKNKMRKTRNIFLDKLFISPVKNASKNQL